MAKWRLGSLFSGVGALDLAVETVYDAKTVWQVERERLPVQVLRRHFGPEGSTVIARDIEQVDPAALLAEYGPIDVMSAGFPCQDLSSAGSGEGLDGARSGLYRYVVAFTGVLRPVVVVVENVPKLLHKYRDRVEADFAAIGYGVTWRRCSATAAGAPHLRKRVFLEIVRADVGGGHCSVVHVVDDGASGSLWPTPTASNPNEGEDLELWEARRSRVKNKGTNGNGFGTPLAIAVAQGARWSRLNADWHAALMGLPPTWTDPEGPSLYREAIALVRSPRWPAGRGEDQYAWEPPRLVEGTAIPGRPARIKASGNAVVPQAAALALWWS